MSSAGHNTVQLVTGNKKTEKFTIFSKDFERNLNILEIQMPTKGNK
jgi:hypothetical protein